MDNPVLAPSGGLLDQKFGGSGLFSRLCKALWMDHELQSEVIDAREAALQRVTQFIERYKRFEQEVHALRQAVAREQITNTDLRSDLEQEKRQHGVLRKAFKRLKSDYVKIRQAVTQLRAKSEEDDKQLAEAKQKQAAMVTQELELRSQLSQAQDEVTQLKLDLTTLRSSLDRLMAERELQDAQLATNRSELVQRDQQNRALKQQVATLQEAFGQLSALSEKRSAQLDALEAKLSDPTNFVPRTKLETAAEMLKRSNAVAQKAADHNSLLQERLSYERDERQAAQQERSNLWLTIIKMYRQDRAHFAEAIRTLPQQTLDAVQRTLTPLIASSARERQQLQQRLNASLRENGELRIGLQESQNLVSALSDALEEERNA